MATARPSSRPCGDGGRSTPSLAALVRDAVDEGSLRDDLDPDLVSRLLFGMVNSLIEWLRPGTDGATDVAAVAHTLGAVAFDGLRRP